MSAQGAGGAAEQNPGQGARPAQQVQGILSLVPAGPQLVPAAARRRGGGRPRGALNQSTRRAAAATAQSAAFLGRFLAAASAPPRDLAEEGLAAAAGALYAKEGVEIEEGHVYSEEELRGTFSRAEAREVVNTMEAMMRRIEADDAIAVRKQREHELEVEEEETAAPRAHIAWREVDIKRARALWDANPGASSTDIAVLFNAGQMRTLDSRVLRRWKQNGWRVLAKRDRGQGRKVAYPDFEQAIKLQLIVLRRAAGLPVKRVSVLQTARKLMQQRRWSHVKLKLSEKWYRAFRRRIRLVWRLATSNRNVFNRATSDQVSAATQRIQAKQRELYPGLPVDVIRQCVATGDEAALFYDPESRRTLDFSGEHVIPIVQLSTQRLTWYEFTDGNGATPGIFLVLKAGDPKQPDQSGGTLLKTLKSKSGMFTTGGWMHEIFTCDVAKKGGVMVTYKRPYIHGRIQETYVVITVQPKAWMDSVAHCLWMHTVG